MLVGALCIAMFAMGGIAGYIVRDCRSCQARASAMKFFTAGTDSTVVAQAQAPAAQCKAFIDQRDQLTEALGRCQGLQRRVGEQLTRAVEDQAVATRRIEDLAEKNATLEREKAALASQSTSFERQTEARLKKIVAERGTMARYWQVMFLRQQYLRRCAERKLAELNYFPERQRKR